MFVARVKNVLSADTVVLVPLKPQCPAPERTLSLSHVRAELYAAKEAVRLLLLGKEIKFKVNYKAPSGHEFGDIATPLFGSMVEYGLEQGWFKLRDGGDDELRGFEDKAHTNAVGVWAGAAEPLLIELDELLVAKSQRAPITTVVERVISGDRVMARIVVNKTLHVVTPLLLAGVKCPRTDDATQAPALTQVAHQAKQFVELKLMTTAAIKCRIVGELQTGVPVAVFEHPSGNSIHEALLEHGLAEVVDWQSSLLGLETMARLRKAELTARAMARGVFVGNAGVSHASAVSSGELKVGTTLTATVAKVITADTLVLRLGAKEATVQLSSIRAPRANDPVFESAHDRVAMVNTAREFVRNLSIGKLAQVYVDGVRLANKELGLEERFVVTLKLNGRDLSEAIVSAGMATVIKHNRATAHERSLNWDRLVELEQEQIKLAKNGVYSGGNPKVLKVALRVVDALENLAKAKTFFNGLRQRGRGSGFHVEYILSATRIKLYHPREGLKLTLLLGGLAKGELAEALQYMNQRFLQRAVEFDVYDQDRVGGFIGNLFALNKALEPVQVQLLLQGLVKTHETALHSNPFALAMKRAEEEAQDHQRGVWAGYDRNAAQVTAQLAQTTLAVKPQFFDAEVTHVDDEGVVHFQICDGPTAAKFDQFKREFAAFHAQQPSASANSPDLPHNLAKPAKKGDLVSAKFSENGKYYRAKVLSFDRVTNKFEVKHIDFGNVDHVALAGLRALPAKFGVQQWPVFAHTCVLQNLRLPPTRPTDYLTDALYALEELCYDKKLVVSGVPSRTPGVEYEAVLYDAQQSLTNPNYTINTELVLQGWAVVDTRKTAPPTKSYDDGIKAAQESARAGHLGCWEFGDVTYDDDLE
jgi:staphylococcal nuclease domain-containing protein 1